MECKQHMLSEFKDADNKVYVGCVNTGCTYKVSRAVCAKEMLEWMQAREQRAHDAFAKRTTEYVASLTPEELAKQRAEAGKGWPNLDQEPLLESDPPRRCTEVAVRNMGGENSHNYGNWARGDNVVQRDGSVIMRCACGHRKVARTADDYGPKHRAMYTPWNHEKQKWDDA